MAWVFGHHPQSLQCWSTTALGRVEKFPRDPQSKPNSKSGKVQDCTRIRMQKKLRKFTRTAQRTRGKKFSPIKKWGSIVLLSQDGLSCEPLNGLGCAFPYTTLGPVGPKKGVKCCAICTRASMTRYWKKKKKKQSMRSLVEQNARNTEGTTKGGRISVRQAGHVPAGASTGLPTYHCLQNAKRTALEKTTETKATLTPVETSSYVCILCTPNHQIAEHLLQYTLEFLVLCLFQKWQPGPF